MTTERTHVLLTGAAGFVGSHMLARLLRDTDWIVHCPVSFRHRGNPDRIAQVLRGAEQGDDLSGAAAWERVRIDLCDLSAPISPTMMDRWKGCRYVFNVASSSHVDRSITDPGPFIQNNVALMTNVLDAARQMPGLEMFLQMSTDEVYGPAPQSHDHVEWETILPSNPYSASKAAQEAIAFSYWRTYAIPLVITNCYDMQTRVMTEHGFKGYEDLAVGDRVWTLDASENLVLETVERTVKMPGDGRMVRFKGNGVDQLVTRNHRMMVRRAHGKPRQFGAIEEAHAETFIGMKGRVRVPRTGVWSGNDPGPVFRPYEHILDVPHVSGKRLPDEMPMEQAAALFGWFVSEGFTSGTTACFGAAYEPQQQIIFDLLAGIEGIPYVNAHSVRIANSHLVALLSLCGHGSKNVGVPDFIRAWDEKYLRIFYEAAIAGDGTRYKTNDVYYTASPILAEHMAEVGMKLGYSVRISERETKNPRKDSWATSWVVRMSSCAGEIESRNVTEEDYDGDVWCLSVPSGRVFVERNGVISLSGQTMNIIGERQDPEKFLPLVIKKLLCGEKITVHASTTGESGSRFYLDAANLADVWLHIVETARDSDYLLVQYYADGFDRPTRYNVVGEREIKNDELVRTVAYALALYGKLPGVMSDVDGMVRTYTVDAFIGTQIEYVDFHSSRPGHDLRYALNGAKIRNELDWIPPIPLTDSILRTVRWYLDNPEWLAG